MGLSGLKNVQFYRYIEFVLLLTIKKLIFYLPRDASIQRGKNARNQVQVDYNYTGHWADNFGNIHLCPALVRCPWTIPGAPPLPPTTAATTTPTLPPSTPATTSPTLLPMPTATVATPACPWSFWPLCRRPAWISYRRNIPHIFLTCSTVGSYIVLRAD